MRELSEDDISIAALLEFLNAVEAGIERAKRVIKEAKGVSRPEKEPQATSWDPSKIVWTTAESSRGPYEKSEDVNSLDFKNLLKDLAIHKGKLQRNEFFYWTFQNGTTVGRKKRGKQA